MDESGSKGAQNEPHSYVWAPQVASTKILAEFEAPQHNSDCCPFCAWLLLACCLLAKPVRSTPNTKEGYKTKLGLTNLVTLALTRIEYWDGAGGGRNIICESSTTNEVPTGK